MSAEQGESSLIQNPRPALIVGVLGGFLAYLASCVTTQSVIVVIPLLAALLATGIAVVIAPKNWWVLATSALVALLAMLTAGQSGWDPALKGFFWLIAVLAGLCAFVTSMPRPVQRFVVSLVILFHFGGIVTAVTSVHPQPWVAGWLWSWVYRPYLQFMYLNNAYHFYSPEPGPATLMWFRIEYEPDKDGKTYYRWVKIPDLDSKGTPIDFDEMGERRRLPFLLYTRRLSMAELTNTSAGLTNVTNFDKLLREREMAAISQGIPPLPQRFRALGLQYMEPNFIAKRWIASHAAHVARTYKHADHPEKKVTGVKVYRITHMIVDWREFSTYVDEDGVRHPGKSFHDPTLYLPVYVGEFDAHGEMKKSCRERGFDKDGKLVDVHRDPLLYWVIPILPYVREGSNKPPPYDYEIINYVKLHAGDVLEAKPERQEAGSP